MNRVWQPLGTRVLVMRRPEPRLQSETLIIPETVEDPKPSAFATVLGVGAKVREPITIGDTVVLSDYAGAPCLVTIASNEIEAHMVDEKDVLGVLKENR